MENIKLDTLAGHYGENVVALLADTEKKKAEKRAEYAEIIGASREDDFGKKFIAEFEQNQKQAAKNVTSKKSFSFQAEDRAFITELNKKCSSQLRAMVQNIFSAVYGRYGDDGAQVLAEVLGFAALDMGSIAGKDVREYGA